MKRSVPSSAISITLLLGAFGFLSCQPAAPDTNRNAASNANANVAKETVNPVAIEAEIIKLENDWAAAVQHHDVEGIRKILADDLVMILEDGGVGTKAGEVRNAESGAMTVGAWELKDTKVTVLSADAAFITGRGIIKNGKYKDPVTNTVTNISGEYRFTDIYARRNGQWLAVSSQVTKIKNPSAASPVPGPAASVEASPK
jgi:ketosteroid isomerase-like protein